MRTYYVVLSAIVIAFVLLLALCLPSCAPAENPWLRTGRELRIMQDVALKGHELAPDPVTQARFTICYIAALKGIQASNGLIKAQAMLAQAKRQGVVIPEVLLAVQDALRAALAAREEADEACLVVGIKRRALPAMVLDAGAVDGSSSPVDAGAHDAGSVG